VLPEQGNVGGERKAQVFMSTALLQCIHGFTLQVSSDAQQVSRKVIPVGLPDYRIERKFDGGLFHSKNSKVKLTTGQSALTECFSAV
jgi:hypothetical protein